VSPAPLDPAAVPGRRDGFASHGKDDSQVAWLAQAGIDLVQGHGRIVAHRTVTVADDDGRATTLTARHAVVIATGSAVLLPGLLESEPWTSRAAAAGSIPDRLAIIGGGVVATEMATAFASLGSTVTVLARDGILPAAEPFAGELVTAALRESGVAALHADGYTGRARMVVDEDRRVILGVTFVGPDVAELIHAATIAIAVAVPIDRLWHAVPAFPTVSEVWPRLLETHGRPS
jgi:pyruvate/2-oxoglutarate dehydrogenase complex dihydrolipoamide dehydrogenase (E3) component